GARPVWAPLPCPPGVAAGASGRVETPLQVAVQTPAASPFAEQERIRRAIPDAVAASGGGDVDWFAGQVPGHGIVFPAAGYNPRSPSTRVVARHRPGETAKLTINGEPPSVVNMDGTPKSADASMAVTMGRGLPLPEGDNGIVVEVRDPAGQVPATPRHPGYYPGFAASAGLVPEQSIPVADGIHRPVLAIRLRDRRGHPVRDGLVGEYAIAAPYLPARTVQQMQEHQVIGRSNAPAWRV